MEEEIRIKIAAETDAASKSLGALEKDCERLKKELSSLKQGTSEYNAKLKELEQATSSYNTASAAATKSTMATGQAIGAMSGVIGATASAFGAYVAVSGLAAEGNEAVAKTIQKVQAAMAIGQTFTALTGAISGAQAAFAALNAVMLANPIGAVVAAVALLVAGLIALFARLDDDSKKLEEIKLKSEAFAASQEELNATLEKETKLMQARGASQEELSKKRIADLKLIQRQRDAEIARLQDEIKAEQARIQQSKESWQGLFNFINMLLTPLRNMLKSFGVDIADGVNAVQEAIWDGENDVTDALNAQIEELTSKRLEGAKAVEAAEFDLLLVQEGNAAKAKEAAAQKAAADIDSANKRREAEALAAQTEIKLIHERRVALEQYYQQKEYESATLEKRMALDTIRLESLSKEFDLLKQTASTSDDFARLLEIEKERDGLQKNIAAAQSEINAGLAREAELREQLSGLLAQAGEQKDPSSDAERAEKETAMLEMQLANSELRMQNAELETATRIAAAQKYLDAKTKLLQKEVAETQKAEAAKKALQSASANAFTAALDLASAAMKDNAKAQKALDVGKATVSTFVAANTALASAPPPANFVLMGAAIAAGLANVVSILNTDVGDGGGGGATPVAPTVAAPALEQTQSEVIEAHINRTPEEERESRVYIVESDIAKAQKSRVQLEQETKF